MKRYNHSRAGNTQPAKRRSPLFSTCLGAFLWACLWAANSYSANQALNIALTNDDGWDAGGVQALFQVLTEQGHQVTLVGSATQQSGSSAALNGGPLRITKQAARQFSAALAADDAQGAEPLSSGMLAVAIATQLDGSTPDLLLSGINSGANIGAAALHSGTVGAVIGAISAGVDPQLPGIAISTDEPRCDTTCKTQHYNQVAQYAAHLLQQLQQHANKSEAPLLPQGLGLNVNYPQRASAEIRGARLTEQSAELGFGGNRARFGFQCLACAALELGETASTKGLTGGPGELPAGDDDVAAFIGGYISIVPIHANYTAWPALNKKRGSNRRANKALTKLLANSWPITKS